MDIVHIYGLNNNKTTVSNLLKTDKNKNISVKINTLSNSLNNKTEYFNVYDTKKGQ